MAQFQIPLPFFGDTGIASYSTQNVTGNSAGGVTVTVMVHGGNDAGMLRYAGLAVAMGNANDAVKALAHRITDDNDHDGVAKAVWRVLEEQYGISD
jgi:hypothetical protein